MSDDQNPAPRSEGETPATPDSATPPAPPAPPVPPSPAAEAYPAPSGPAYGAPAPSADAPASGAPAAPEYAAPAAPAYGAPAAPAYGAPTYGQPYGAAPFAAVRTNTLSIISLVASIAGFLLILPIIGPIAGVITGHISLAQIKRTGEKGRGMALAGTIVGWVSIALIVLFVIILFVGIGIAASNSSRYGS